MAANQRAPFPTNPEDFDADTRVSYSKESKNYILEDEWGEEWEWFPRDSKWVPMMDEALVEQQREAYKMAGVDDEAPAMDPTKKRKAAEAQHEAAKKQKAEKPKERVNTAIYVESLPEDVTLDELKHEFSRFGMIAEGIDDNKPRIKMYYNEQGDFNGDALIVFHRPESVQMAIDMFDDSDFRLGVSGTSGRMRVKAADQNYKAQKESQVNTQEARKRGTAANKDRQKIIKKAEEMNRRLANWDDEDDDPATITSTSDRWDKIVVLEGMFTFDELDEDEELADEIVADLREECAKFGPVEDVVLFDREPKGVMTVRFGNAAAAKACIRKMDGRGYEKRTLRARNATEGDRFSKSR